MGFLGDRPQELFTISSFCCTSLVTLYFIRLAERAWYQSMGKKVFLVELEKQCTLGWREEWAKLWGGSKASLLRSCNLRLSHNVIDVIVKRVIAKQPKG